MHRLLAGIRERLWEWPGRGIPFVRQLSSTECGAACLAMVLGYHGRTVGVEELRNLAVGARDASNAQALIDTARVFGLRGRAVSLDIDQLAYLDRGAILHWAFSHFVVFDRFNRTSVFIVDPLRGRRRVPIEQFRKLFTGVAVVFERTDLFAREYVRPTRYRYYRSHVLREWRFLPHIVLTSLLLQALGLGLPLMSRAVVDRVIPTNDRTLLVILSVAAASLVIFQVWTSTLRSVLLVYLRTRIDNRTTLYFFDHLLSLPYDFFQRRSTGDLMLRMSSNSIVREVLTNTTLAAILDGTLVVGYLIVLASVSWPIALLVAGVAALQIVVALLSHRRQHQLLAEGLDAQSRSQSYLMEVLSAVEVLKALGAHDRIVDRWAHLFTAELNVSLKRGRLDGIVEGVRGGIRLAASLMLLLVGATQVIAGAISLGDMLAVTALASGFLAPVTALIAAGTRFQVLGVYMERLVDVLQTPSERDQTILRPPPRLTGTLSADNLGFRYGPTSAMVIRHVSLSVAPGEFVAVVGRSGAGKSTLVRLLIGLYVPSVGVVRYDGVDLMELDIVGVRRQLGVVTQQAQLFGGSIRSNIALADPAIPLNAVIDAATLACIHDDIVAMPLGYDTPLIDRGASLSGGQQQRIALARALVGDPRILVLDEATSQLDAATERLVYERLSHLPCTRLVLAHRLSTIMRADRILVMDAGRLVEQGTHLELMASGGVYAELVATQVGGDRGVDYHTGDSR